MNIREYYDDYIKYYPDRWSWSLKNTDEQSELYMRTRARRTKSDMINRDLLPDFYSIERDAAQFGFKEVEWTDFFGLIWEGRKGVRAMAGAPNYEGNLYYYSPDEYDESDGQCVSELYDAYGNQPPDDIYIKVSHRGVNYWVNSAEAVDVEYHYVVNNHLFKDTYVKFIYEDGQTVNVWDDYQALISGLLRQGKKEFVSKILESMNEHFLKLRDSDREEERYFYPGKTAEEMFLGNREED